MVPVFGSGGSSREGLSMLLYSLTERTVLIPVSVPENGSGGSSSAATSAFGSWENGSDGSGFLFRFGSSATLNFYCIRC